MTPEDEQFLERWAHAYLLVSSIPRDRRFKMDTWGNRDTRSVCGTAACLAGHCGITPWFRLEGFKLMALDGQLKPDWRATDHGDVGNYAAEFFGSGDWGESPFAPGYCNRVLSHIFNEKDGARLTPKRMMKVVKYYMCARWGIYTVNKAIITAEETNKKRRVYSSTYNADFIHKLLGWAT